MSINAAQHLPTETPTYDDIDSELLRNLDRRHYRLEKKPTSDRRATKAYRAAAEAWYSAIGLANPDPETIFRIRDTLEEALKTVRAVLSDRGPNQRLETRQGSIEYLLQKVLSLARESLMDLTSAAQGGRSARPRLHVVG